MGECIKTRRGIFDNDFQVATWESGSDNDVKFMVDSADVKTITLSNYWAVGDTRSVNIASFSGNTTATHVAQTIELVLMHSGLYKNVDNKTINFIIGAKNVFSNNSVCEIEAMKSGFSYYTDFNWDDSLIRNLLNDKLYNALPQWLISIIKTVQVVTGRYKSSNSGITTVNDNIFLPAEKEIIGYNSKSITDESNNLTQFQYYTTSNNRIKKAGSNGAAVAWWLRSPVKRGVSSSSYCLIVSSGAISYNVCTGQFGVAPHFCI